MIGSETSPLIPREVLFGNPERTRPNVSPDGKHLAYLAPVDGVLNVWAGPVGSPAGGDNFRPITQDTSRGIRVYIWAEDDRHLLYLQDVGGDEDWRLYSVDLTPGETRDLTPFEKVQVRITDLDKDFPDELLVSMNKEDPRTHDVYRLRLSSGELELVGGRRYRWTPSEREAARVAWRDAVTDPRGRRRALRRRKHRAGLPRSRPCCGGPVGPHRDDGRARRRGRGDIG